MQKSETDIMRGLSFVAPPKPFPKDPMPPIVDLGADWIAVIPYGFTRLGTPRVQYDRESKWQWWGEKPEGCLETIQQAKAAGLKVMLKPQVYIPGGWPGGLNFSSEVEWKEWEDTYEAFLLPFVEMAVKNEVELICIGTEFKISSIERPQFWRHLIRKIRGMYDGKLTYAANWDEFEKVSFWNELDYIGVDAYFPLNPATTPSIAQLKKAWKQPKKKIESIVKEFQKPVLFTEFGYLSVDGCAYNNWELESKVKSMPINELAQANALDALFEVFWEEPYWHGGFIWKWFPNLQGHEGYLEKDYTPQGKIGEQVVKSWYDNQ